jgi:RimJ/RimL family protein N-acetyltransferase
MPAVTDLHVVRSALNRDRWWSAYAIGDLSPGLVEHCEWRASTSGDALVLLYRGFEPPILFAMGPPPEIGLVVAELTAPEVSLHLPPLALDPLTASYTTTFTRPMKRMALPPEMFTPAASPDVRVVDERDLAALTALYDEGHRRGDGPAFFHAAMLRQKTFRGIWEGDRLVAVAGTHLYSPGEGVCAIGNIYTRSDRRGHGLAARVTSAVVAHALTDRIPTIVLNVGRDNTTAQRVYERLGFQHYCEFVEGEARRG